MAIIVGTIDPRTGELGTYRAETDDALEAECEVRELGLWVDTMRMERVVPAVESIPFASRLPRQAGGASRSARGPHLIEQTAKVYKMWMLIGGISAVLSVPTCMIGAPVAGASPGAGAPVLLLGMLMFLGGLCVFIGARIMAWWNHG